MRKELHKSLDKFRVQFDGYESPSGVDYGMFMVKLPNEPNEHLKVMSSGSQSDWEHVSVSAQGRCPTWEEMCFVKDLFWSGSETVIQFHPEKSRYKNVHNFCLHLWKKTGVNADLPPLQYV